EALLKDGMQLLERLERSDPENQRAKDSIADALNDLGARAFAAAQQRGVPSARRRVLLAQAIDSWTQCHERIRAERAQHFDCGDVDASLERARALLAQERRSPVSPRPPPRAPSP